MLMTPRLRKAVLTSHITSSVGWLGAVAVFLALAIAGLTTTDNQIARAACIAMGVSAWYVIVPFCFASLSTGIIQALGTKWGLLKHYWTAVKLFLTIVLTVLLLVHMQPISFLATEAATATALDVQDSAKLINITSKAGAALLALIAITTISVYKPWGKIQYRQPRAQSSEGKDRKRSLSFYLLIGAIALIIFFVAIHLFKGSMTMH